MTYFASWTHCAINYQLDIWPARTNLSDYLNSKNWFFRATNQVQNCVAIGFTDPSPSPRSSSEFMALTPLTVLYGSVVQLLQFSAVSGESNAYRSVSWNWRFMKPKKASILEYATRWQEFRHVLIFYQLHSDGRLPLSVLCVGCRENNLPREIDATFDDFTNHNTHIWLLIWLCGITLDDCNRLD